MKGKRILFYVLYTIVLIAHVFVCDLSVEISMGWDIDMALPLSIALNILLFLIYIPFKKKLIHKIFIIIETIVIAVLTFAIFSNDSTGVGIILIPCSYILLLLVYFIFNAKPKNKKEKKEKRIETAVEEQTSQEVVCKCSNPIGDNNVVDTNENQVKCDSIILDENSESEKMSAWMLFKYGFSKAINYLFKSKQFVKHLVYLVIIFVGSLFSVLAPFISISNTKIAKSLCDDEKIDYLSSINGVSSVERYGKYYLAQVLRVVIILGTMVAVALPFVGLGFALSDVTEACVILYVVGALLSALAGVVLAVNYFAVDYLYYKYDSESAEYLIASKKLMNGKKKRLILFSLIAGIIYSLVLVVPYIFVGLAIANDALPLLGVAALLLLIELPVVTVGINTSIYKLLAE